MVDSSHPAWREGHITGIFLMDIMAAFLSIGRGRLIDTMRGEGMDRDLVRWRASCLTDHTVEIIIHTNALERQLIELGIPQGLSVPLILFTIVKSGRWTWLEESIYWVKGLTLVDNVGCVATGSNFKEIVWKLDTCASESITWAALWELEFETARTDAAHFTRRRGHEKPMRPTLTANIRVGNGFVRCDKDATR